jgi:hypothetical protein
MLKMGVENFSPISSKTAMWLSSAASLSDNHKLRNATTFGLMIDDGGDGVCRR